MSIKRFVSALLTGALCLGVLTACGSAQKPASSGVSADAPHSRARDTQPTGRDTLRL